MQDNTITETEKLQAENENLKQLLEEYQQAALLKNMEQRELEEKAASGAEAKSYYDLQTEELKYVRNYINELMQKAEAAAQREAELEKQVTQSISTASPIRGCKN